MNDDEDYKRTIYVGNLPQDVTEQGLYAFFITFGDIKSVQIPKDHLTEKNRGFAFVEFDEIGDAKEAIENYDRTEFMGRTIKVKKSRRTDLKPNYNGPVWNNDDWLQKIEQNKIENDEYTKQREQRSKAHGLPIFTELEKKRQEHPVVYVEQED